MLYLMPGRASQTNYRFAGWLTKSRLPHQHLPRSPLFPRHLFPDDGKNGLAESSRAKPPNHSQAGERRLLRTQIAPQKSRRPGLMRRYGGAGYQRRSERLNPLPDCLDGAASGQNWIRVTRMLYLMPGRASQTNYRFAGWLTKSGVY